MNMAHGYILIGALLSLALPLIVSMETCPSTGTPGIPGIPGLPGRDGRHGETGERGHPAVAADQGLLGPQRGDKGSSGATGPGGKRGQSGERGPIGGSGHTGSTGEPGDSSSAGGDQRSAFSVARQTADYPAKNSPIRFLQVITNINNDYNTETGRFRCRIAGTYYFVYHASAEDRLCLLLKLDQTLLASFCDFVFNNNPRQVSSGGLAVYLRTGQEVWLETNDHRGMTGKREGSSVFSGFLIHAH